MDRREDDGSAQSKPCGDPQADCHDAPLSGGKWTPGPWTVWPSLYDGMAATVVHDVEPLETVAEVRSYANAHLIAAAPAMAEALKAVKEHDDFVPVLPRAVLAKVNAALAAVDGREP